jgi:sulfatase modifying factor 1
MMKRFTLGMVLSGLMGVALFGSSSRHAASVAQADATEVSETTAAVLVKAEPVAEGAIHSSLGAKISATPQVETAGRCPTGMAEVEGDYCSSVEQKCLRWLDPETKQRCAEFAPTSACKGKLVHKHFCVDRFEYPNVQGEKPVVMKTWVEAKGTCESEGKRLCGESEWTLACEGVDRLPYPYGYARNEDACNIDKPHPDVDELAIADPARRDAEVARLDQRDAAGAREACVSPYGVNDMTGNVDEWVVNESGKPYKSGLKGGYWGPVRDRCRPMTIAHNEEFAFYQIGFRCCGEPAGAGKGPSALGHGPVAPPRANAQGTMLTDS